MSSLTYVERIRRMAEDGGTSLSEVADVLGWDIKKTGSYVCGMVRDGKLVKAKPNGTTRARYYVAPPRGAIIEDAEPEPAPEGTVARSTPLWRHDQPLTVTRRRGIKVTIGPSTARDPRYQCGRADEVWGAGFAAAGIGRDVTTGKEWEDRK